MRIPSGSSDRYLYFVAVDATDLKTRETGLSGFTVVRSRNGAADVTYTTPTISEIDATTMPGLYALLIDEDTSIAAGHDTEEYAVHITHASMAPVSRVVELYRPETTEGRTLSLESDGMGHADLKEWLGTAPLALVAQRVAALVGAMAANVLDSSALDASAVTEIQTGLATSAALATVQGDTDNIQTRLPAALVGGLMASDLGTWLGVAPFALDAQRVVVDVDHIRDDKINSNTFDDAAITAAAIAPAAIGTSEAPLLANLDATVSSRSSHTAADIWAVGSRTLTSFGTLVADVATAVWGAITRTLTSSLDPTAAQIRSEMDSNSVDLNSILAYVDELESRLTALRAGYLDNLPNLDVAVSTRGTADTGDDMGLTGAAIDALLDDVVEGTLTFRQMLRIFTAALAGLSTGGGTANIAFRDVADGKDRILASVDAQGNRLTIVLDGT